MAISNHLLARYVANEMGVEISPRNAQKTEWNIDICQADFDACLADCIAENASPVFADRTAYNSIQSEGY